MREHVGVGRTLHVDIWMVTLGNDTLRGPGHSKNLWAKKRG